MTSSLKATLLMVLAIFALSCSGAVDSQVSPGVPTSLTSTGRCGADNLHVSAMYQQSSGQGHFEVGLTISLSH